MIIATGTTPGLQENPEMTYIAATALQKKSMKHLFACLMLVILAAPPAIAASTETARPAAIRVLIALGPSTYFFRDGRPHGVEYAWLLEFEKFVNQGRSSTRRSRLQFVPVDQGELIPALYEGRGDMAAGLIPASEGLGRLVTLTDPLFSDKWCVLGNRNARLPDDIDEMSRQRLALPMSSYGRRLLHDVNQERRLAGRDEVEIGEAPLGITAEKMISEAHQGGKQLTLASRFVTGLWAKVFPRAALGACLDAPVPVVWAVGKENTALHADLNRFIAARKPAFIERGIEASRKYLSAAAVGTLSRAIDPLDKLAFFAPVLQLAASANNLDWLLLAAIGQRETGLAEVRRKSGPTGVMQVDPATARRMGVRNPHDTSQNITAAARYLDHLRKMFTNPDIGADDQLYFMLAAYNAGEGRLQGLRKEAAAAGLDPNRWHGHVEVVARRSVGENVVNYVTAVSRYYRAYQSADRRNRPEAERPASAPAVR